VLNYDEDPIIWKAEGLIAINSTRQCGKTDITIHTLKLFRLIDQNWIFLERPNFYRLVKLLHKLAERYPAAISLNKEIRYDDAPHMIVGWLDFHDPYQDRFDFSGSHDKRLSILSELAKGI